MKVRMIYLAAGNSRRFGSNKLLYEIKGKPMFQYGLEALAEVLEKVEEASLVVVTNFPEIERYVRERVCAQKGKAAACRGRIRTVKSPDSEKGISYSIRAGLLCPGEEADYYLFCVADQPYISSKSISRLIWGTVESGCIGGFMEWEGGSGNPAVFSKELLPELLTLQGDNGGKKLLAGREKVCRIRAGKKEELDDLDFMP